MELTSEQLKEKIASGESFIVDMYANWCGPCKILGPIIENFANKLQSEGSKVGVYKFDIESDKELAVSMGVRSIPTIKAYSGGQNVDTKMGILREQQLRDMISVL